MKYIKKFNETKENEYDPFDYNGCGCCPVCTGELDCECGCPECNCPPEDDVEVNEIFVGKTGMDDAINRLNDPYKYTLQDLENAFMEGHRYKGDDIRKAWSDYKKKLKIFENFDYDRLGSIKLEIGSHYHWDSVNSKGENTSTDCEYLGEEGNHVIFKVIKSYMDDSTKKRYDKVGLEHFHTIGGKMRTTLMAVNRDFKFGKFYKIEK